jgi:hypothetical protein
MHRIRFALVGTAALLFLIGGAATAQETGGVVINGTVKNSTTVQGSSHIAAGAGSTARTSIGSISDGVKINGKLNMIVNTDEVTNIADDPGETAITSIGSVHKGAKGKGDITVHTGKVTNVPAGKDKTACVIIGSQGAIDECDQ